MHIYQSLWVSHLEQEIMLETNIRLTNTIAAIALLTITGCSSHSHHQNLRAKHVVVKEVIVNPVIQKTVVIKRRRGIAYR
jgi:lipoprotein NlpI